MKMSLTLLLLPCCLLSALAPATSSGTLDCAKLVSEVMSRNSPELLLLPTPNPESEFNTFIATEIRVRVDWSRIRESLKETDCVESYMVEYRPFKYYDAASASSRVGKRESGRPSTSHISPPMDASATHADVRLPDDCNVYSVQLVAVTKTAEPELARSASRKCWPSGRRATVERFSEGIVLALPPSCGHVFEDWRVETCATRGDECDLRTLQSGESPLHISDLRPCTSYSMRLLSPAASDNGLGDEDSSEVLWSFAPPTRTLPRPDFDVRAGHDRLRLRITQPGCEAGAAVDHWRITRCTHEPKRAKQLFASNRDEEEEEEEEGSGGDDNESEEYYYYEDPSSDTDRCVNTQHTVAGNSGEIELAGLEECTLYSLDITPTAAAGGETLQPGEQYGTIHSTLCAASERAEDDWFGETEVGGSPTTKRPAHRSSDTRRKHDSPPPSFVSTTTTTSDAVPHYLLLAAGSLLFALLGLFGLWLGCFYLSGGGGGAGGFGSRAAAMHGKSGHIGDDEDGDSLCTEESSVVTTAPSPHVMTLLKK